MIGAASTDWQEDRVALLGETPLRLLGRLPQPGELLEASIAAFGLSFGVAVQGHGRIAHGLFALVDGVFVGAEVPFQQLAVPDVGAFLDRVERLLLRRPAMTALGDRKP